MASTSKESRWRHPGVAPTACATGRRGLARGHRRASGRRRRGRSACSTPGPPQAWRSTRIASGVVPSGARAVWNSSASASRRLTRSSNAAPAQPSSAAAGSSGRCSRRRSSAVPPAGTSPVAQGGLGADAVRVHGRGPGDDVVVDAVLRVGRAGRPRRRRAAGWSRSRRTAPRERPRRGRARHPAGSRPARGRRRRRDRPSWSMRGRVAPISHDHVLRNHRVGRTSMRGLGVGPWFSSIDAHADVGRRWPWRR